MNLLAQIPFSSKEGPNCIPCFPCSLRDKLVFRSICPYFPSSLRQSLIFRSLCPVLLQRETLVSLHMARPRTEKDASLIAHAPSSHTERLAFHRIRPVLADRGTHLPSTCSFNKHFPVLRKEELRM